LLKVPEVDIIITVRPITFTLENLKRLWEKVSQFPTLMGNEVHTQEDMMRFFVSEPIPGEFVPRGLCMVIDDFIGIFWLGDINGLMEASVHYTFFDRRHRGRVDLCKKAIEYAFRAYQFHRLFTKVPVSEVRVMAFVESLGFVKEGRLRRSTYYRSKFYDTNVYGLLREEYLNGQSRLQQAARPESEADRERINRGEPAEV
jgi:RimJ/RimL family protein N-acetyltransferase